MTARDAELYQSIAAVRRFVLSQENIPADELRALVIKCLEAVEILAQSTRDLEVIIREQLDRGAHG